MSAQSTTKPWVHPRDDPSHPASKLPASQGYLMTDDELRAAKKHFGLGQFKASSVQAARPVPSTADLIGVQNVLPLKAPPVQVSSPEPRARSLREIKQEAAEALTRAYAMHGPAFRIKVQSIAQWEADAKAHAKQHGCDVAIAMQKVGFVHSHLSLPPVRDKTVPAAAISHAAVNTSPTLVAPRYADAAPFTTADKEAAGKAYVVWEANNPGGRVQQHPAETWNALAHQHHVRVGCSEAEGLRRAGFIHPAISVSNSAR